MEPIDDLELLKSFNAFQTLNPRIKYLDLAYRPVLSPLAWRHPTLRPRRVDNADEGQACIGTSRRIDCDLAAPNLVLSNHPQSEAISTSEALMTA
jgi:hypothetical protein